MIDRFKFRSFGRPNSIIEGMQNIYTFEETENGYANVKVEKGWLAFVEKENLKIMQCTGLKDKNGKLIFEGDIVKLGNGSINGSVMELIYEVEWNINSFNIPSWIINAYDFSHYIEVIGNIYENPELLKDGE